MDIFNGYDGRLFFDGQYETEDPYEILNNPFNQFNLLASLIDIANFQLLHSMN